MGSMKFLNELQLLCHPDAFPRDCIQFLKCITIYENGKNTYVVKTHEGGNKEFSFGNDFTTLRTNVDRVKACAFPA